MADFEINNPTTFTENIRKFETTDEGHADVFNHVAAALVNNDAYLKENKVDKEKGKGLSENDYTNADKKKLNGIQDNAQANAQSDWNEANTNSDAYIKNKPQSMKNPKGLNIKLNGVSQGSYDGSSQKDVNITAEKIGADSSGTAQAKVTEHNTSEAAHADIRELITNLATRLNALADSDDTTLDQLSEIVAYIKSNRSLIENITTKKVNVDDIIDNLTSSAANKVLSAKQGKILKDLIDTLTNTIDGKVSKSGDTMTGTLYTKNTLVSSSSEGGGTEGYINFARIKITGQYADRVIAFKIGGRQRRVTNVFVKFSGDSSNPNLHNCWINGDCTYGIYIVKSNESTSTWDLYAQKFMAWGEVSVLSSHYTGSVEVTYPGTFTAEKGNDWIEATIETVGNAFDSNTLDGKHASDFVNKTGDAMTGTLRLLNGSGVNESSGGTDNDGYVNIARIKINETFVDCPIFIQILSKYKNDVANVIIKFGSASNTDPSLDVFQLLNSEDYGIYIAKRTTSVWDLYVNKGGTFGYIFINNIYIPNPDNRNLFSISYPNTHATSKADSWISPTMVIPSGTVNRNGDTMTGDLGIPIGRSTQSVPTAPCSGSISNPLNFNKFKTFLGSYLASDGQWNIISVRHKNGYGDDGQRYGMYLKSKLTEEGNLLWGQQTGDVEKWNPERTILDSVNYKDFCLTKNGGDLNSDGDLSFSELEYSDGGYYQSAIFYINGIGFDYSTYQEDSSENLYETDKHSTQMSAYGFEVTNKVMMNDTGIYPEQSNLLDIGKSSFKWDNIYAANGTIQTSDKTKKKDIKNLDIGLIKAFIMGLKPSSYKMADGTSGRTHWGFISQYVEELMKKLDMTSKDFAGFIKSPKKVIKYEEYEDKNGNKFRKPIEQVIEGEYDYGLRYEEFIAPIISVVQEHEEKIQEQQKTIDKQQETINKQQEEIEELKKEMKELKKFVLKIA